MAMGLSIKTHAAFLCFALSAPMVARAQYGETAQVERQLAATHREDATASGTEIDLTNRPEANESAQDILPEVPGANVVFLGGPFNFVSLSLRGIEAENTTVLLGDLPLSNRDTGAFDFSQISISAFERIEVYRGGAPAWFNNGSIGGVVRLIPRENPTTGVGADVGVGSFGTYQASAEGSVNGDRVRSFNDLRYGRTLGDFPYTNDRCTAFDSSDDGEELRQNNDAQRFQGLSFTEVDTVKGGVDIVLLGTYLDRGIPGAGCDPVLQARQTRTQVFGGLSYTQTGQRKDGKDYELQAVIGGGYVRNQVADPFGEVGIAGPSASDDGTANAYTRIGTRLQMSDQLDLTVLGTAQFDHFQPRTDQIALVPRPSQRVEGAVVLEPRVHGKWRDTLVELRPSVRLGFSQTRLRSFELGPSVDRQSNVFLPTIRIGAAVGPLPWLTIATSGYTGVRLPTVLELFGTRARIEGNPDLNPESGLGADLSVVMAGRSKILKGSAELRGFVNSTRDKIIVQRTIRNQITFRNEDSAKAWGAEARFAGEITPYLTFASTLTGLATRNQDGKQLPAFTPFTTLTRFEGHTRKLGSQVDDLVAFAQFYYRAGGFGDPGNLVPFPDYKPLTLGVYTLMFGERLWIAFTVRNVNDNRSFDVLGYPLPGRNYAGTISYRHRFTGHKRSSARH